MLINIAPGSVRSHVDLVNALDLLLQDALRGTGASTGRSTDTLTYDADFGSFKIKIEADEDADHPET